MHKTSLNLPCFRLLIATGVVLFQRPSHTSPNWPWPNFLTNLRLDRSISHWSRVACDRPEVTGFSIYKSEFSKHVFILIEAIGFDKPTKWFISFGKAAYLNTSLSKVNTKTISIPTIMVHQFLKGPECSSPSNEKSTFVKLPDSIMFHCISISNW